MMELACRTYSGCEKNDPETERLIRAIDDILKCQERCDGILQELIENAGKSEYFELFVSVLGIGDNLAARLLAETGDPTAFRNVRSLVAYAGLDPKKMQSGQQNGEHLGISKKGNKWLRTLLYLAVTCNLKQGDPCDPVTMYYQKKKRQSRPITHAAAVTACSHKMLRILYGLCKSRTFYVKA